MNSSPENAQAPRHPNNSDDQGPPLGVPGAPGLAETCQGPPQGASPGTAKTHRRS